MPLTLMTLLVKSCVSSFSTRRWSTFTAAGLSTCLLMSTRTPTTRSTRWLPHWWEMIKKRALNCVLWAIQISQFMPSVVQPSAILSTLSVTKIDRSEEHTSELQSRGHLVCRLLLDNDNEDRSGSRHSQQ